MHKIFFVCVIEVLVVYQLRMKRAASSMEEGKQKRRRVKYETFKRWIVNNDRELQTMTWLSCETESEHGEKFVMKLKCKICSKYREKLVGRKNFNDKWISEGADLIRTTNFRDHAKSDQHTHAMNLFKKQIVTDKGQGASSYVPIASSL